MKWLFFFLLTGAVFSACKKETHARVDIYLLESFQSVIDSSNGVPLLSIRNAVLEEKPLFADADIAFYRQATTTFHVRKDIQTIFGGRRLEGGFAVAVDGAPVYYGLFTSLVSSSAPVGVATLSPLVASNVRDLTINFGETAGNPALAKLDKRNDSLLISSLRSSGRLR